MKMMKSLVASLFGLVLALNVNAQVEKDNSFVHGRSDSYEWPTDKAVLEKLDKWQDQKFGVLFHWGLYSQAGIVESWELCSEDWLVRWIPNYYDFKKWYWGLIDEFNPTDFDPDQWARIMDEAGMKYMIFTTKHHDGFCMFDSKYTDYSIANGPFKNDPRKDVARHVWDAFRKKNFMMGCYFSKPDWHCEWFWNPEYDTPHRHINYKKERHPEWWKNYQDFTYNQLKELMTEYGSFDILWLDGGWVRGEDVHLDKLLAEVRSTTQPGLISVDRAIKGRNENYQTPERGIPETQLNHPWESCITLSHAWGYIPNVKFKSARTVVGMLAEICAKGGSLALGVGPTPKGLIQPEVEAVLKEVGAWMKANGQAIYNTRITPNYNTGKTWFTADKNGKTLYAIYALADDETLPATIEWEGNEPVGRMTLLKGNRPVSYTCKDGKVTVKLPRGLKNEPVALKFNFKK